MGSGLEHVGDELWIADGEDVRMLGIPFTTRMTLARLADGGLWLHSPVRADEDLVVAVESVGPVRHIVAPNKFHHLFVAGWVEAFPYATTWAAPQLRERVELQFDHDLGDRAEPCWSADFDQLIFAGSEILPEVVFFHRRSKTLIVTDIIQNHEPEGDSWVWRAIKKFNGVAAPNGGTPRDWRLTVTKRELAREARDRILAWDFDRLVLAHGRCIETDAHAYVERALSWLR